MQHPPPTNQLTKSTCLRFCSPPSREVLTRFGVTSPKLVADRESEGGRTYRPTPSPCLPSSYQPLTTDPGYVAQSLHCLGTGPTRVAPSGDRAPAVGEACTWRADYAGGRWASTSREHALGTSQLTELAASGPQAARVATSGAGPPSREALRRGLAVALAEAEIGGAQRARLPPPPSCDRSECRPP